MTKGSLTVLNTVAVATISIAMGLTLLYAVNLMTTKDFSPDFEFDDIQDEEW
jgi:hypothetical protein